MTPELFARDGNRLICMSAVTTLKSRLARDHAAVGIAVRDGATTLTAVGTATVIDPASPSTALRDPSAAAATPAGVARFVAGNATELAGAAVDLLRGRLGGGIPPHRVVLAVELSDVVLSEDVASATAGSGGADVADGVPEQLRDLVVDGPVVVGWLRNDGTPLAIAGTWESATSSAVVPTEVLDGMDAARDGTACLTFDGWTGYGPSGKRGVLLRGTGTSADDGTVTRLTVEPSRVVTWDGVETSSSAVPT